MKTFKEMNTEERAAHEAQVKAYIEKTKVTLTQWREQMARAVKFLEDADKCMSNAAVDEEALDPKAKRRAMIAQRCRDELYTLIRDVEKEITPERRPRK